MVPGGGVLKVLALSEELGFREDKEPTPCVGSTACWVHSDGNPGTLLTKTFSLATGYQNSTSLTEAGGGALVEHSRGRFVYLGHVMARSQCLCGQWRRPYSKQETAKTQDENGEHSGSE